MEPIKALLCRPLWLWLASFWAPEPMGLELLFSVSPLLPWVRKRSLEGHKTVPLVLNCAPGSVLMLGRAPSVQSLAKSASPLSALLKTLAPLKTRSPCRSPYHTQSSVFSRARRSSMQIRPAFMLNYLPYGILQSNYSQDIRDNMTIS